MCIGNHDGSVTKYTFCITCCAFLCMLVTETEAHVTFCIGNPDAPLNYVTCKKRRFQKGVRRKEGT